ncbi:Cardiomyopathy-associated protein 5 [Collichthys lucidus]|uniref:Cardiomyopathy-associated protein 5 n=1 Tax=Collichthys lucidus TaxID=240159 RepID=A0A4U5UVR5_COLLU|nr:Cardiomyopathy-associated protein 5 [Collichthys lucidus]
MSEVSLPNVKQEKKEIEPDLEEIKNKDQQLFSLISDGYEILNIRVPSKLPTVDEEESTELQDNLSYLDQTPKIRSRNHHDWKHQQNHAPPEEEEILDHQESSEQEPSADTELRHTPTPKESTGDIDYFEKFTLVDVVVPGEQAPEPQEVEGEQPAAKPQVEEQKPAKETATDSPSASEDSFVFVTDVEIAGEHLDEVFYGEGAPADEHQRREDDEGDSGTGLRRRRESQRSTKESGSVLFGNEETTLTPIFISSGPPKIIDPILLEEPTAMSFMYSDLYEDAVGERRRSDEECSEAESVTSEKSYKRRLSDSEEPDGYLEKFTLKDEIPTVEVQQEPVKIRKEGRMMWSQKETSVESQVPETKTDQEPEVKTEILSEVTKPVMTDKVKTDSEIKQHTILGSKQHQQEESVPDDESDKTKLIPEAEDKTSTEDTDVQKMEDLSGLHREDIQPEAADVEQNAQTHKVEDATETNIVKVDSCLDIDLHKEDAEQKMEQDEAVAEASEVIVEKLECEVISEQDAKEMPQPETQRAAEEPKSEPGQEKEEKMEIDVEEEEEEKSFDLSPDEEPIEADYDIIDAEEESQARLAAELEGMDWFCLTCGCLLSEDDSVSGEHRSHEVTDVDKAYEQIKEKLSDWISELQGRSENIEDLVSELELAYNSVEDQCVEVEAAMQAQNEEMMALVMEQYNNMSVSMEEEKKAKLEQLYDQIVSFQENIDSAKATLETTTREAETDARSPEDIHGRLNAALDTAMSLELGPKGLLVFEDYAKANTSSSHHAQRKGIPVPQRPTLQPQEPGSATSSSVTVYWKVNPGDIIDCFQVYCMEDPHGGKYFQEAVSEEYRVTVKESYCALEELEPDKTYKVWVMAVNYTGCSLPSERLVFRTAPSVPVIDTERCTIMWDSATLRWTSAKQTPEESYTLEYCRQYELEGEGLRSISGIKSCDQKVLLQPNENYLFYIKAVNEAGASEQSEAALISTKGTRFHLLKASAHPALELSADQTTLHYSQDAPENTPSTGKQCPSILGELLQTHGYYYWETIVSGSTAYRLGVTYSTANRNSPLGENSLSWCLQCIPTPSGYQLLHNDVQSSVFVIEIPERVGTLLDYQLGRLSFYNAQSGQLLGTFWQRFTQPCHPALALEMPGSLEVSMVLEVPEFTKDS